MKGESVGPFGQLHEGLVFQAFRGVVLSQLGAETTGLDSHHGIDVGIEVLLAPEDFCRDLILLRRGARMLQRVSCQIAKKLAKRLGTVQGMAAEKFLDLLMQQSFLSHGEPPAGIVTPK
jgi:hypothetical protein